MTELEKFVNQPGRDKLVKEVRKKINDLGITYIYYQFISVTGRIVGKGVPADHWETLAEKGFQLVYGSTANLFIDRHGDYIGYGPEASELVGIAEPETFVQIPWDKRLARVFCTCFRNREEEEKTRIENILKTVLDLENHGLESWYKDKKNHIEDVTATPTVINYTKRLIQLKQANTNLLTDPIQQEIRTYFQPILEKRNYLGIFIISPYYISLSSMRDQNLGVKNYLFDKREAQVKKAFVFFLD